MTVVFAASAGRGHMPRSRSQAGGKAGVSAGSSEFQRDVVVKTGYVTRRLSTSEAKLWALASRATTRQESDSLSICFPLNLVNYMGTRSLRLRPVALLPLCQSLSPSLAARPRGMPARGRYVTAQHTLSTRQLPALAQPRSLCFLAQPRSLRVLVRPSSVCKCLSAPLKLAPSLSLLACPIPWFALLSLRPFPLCAPSCAFLPLLSRLCSPPHPSSPPTTTSVVHIDGRLWDTCGRAYIHVSRLLSPIPFFLHPFLPLCRPLRLARTICPLLAITNQVSPFRFTNKPPPSDS